MLVALKYLGGQTPLSKHIYGTLGEGMLPLIAESKLENL